MKRLSGRLGLQVVLLLFVLLPFLMLPVLAQEEATQEQAIAEAEAAPVEPGSNVLENQYDFQTRLRELFDQHLRDEPPAAWVVEGVPYLDKECNLGRRNEQ